jgi:2-succinyl-6-hydroxy-2,4-cyclohexadiene-1-carboxylate synthase
MTTGTKKAIIHFELYNFKNPSLVTVVFLHGFSGSSNDWKQIIKMLPVKFQCVAIDLIGHGKSSSPEDINSFNNDAIVAQINSVLNKLKLVNVILVGYSMGGRAALSYALKNTGRVKGLVLESTTPGIIEETLRKERRDNDEKIAGLIANDGIEKFVDYWMNLSIFETQKKLPVEKLKKVRLKKLNNNKTGLINSIRGFGQGVMPQAWEELVKIDFEVLLITGEKDLKYTDINSQMLAKIKHAEHKIITAAGHNIHLEKPEVFVSLLKDFIVKFL